MQIYVNNICSILEACGINILTKNNIKIFADRVL